MSKEVFIVKNVSESEVELKDFGIIIPSGITTDLYDYYKSIASDELYNHISGGTLVRVIEGTEITDINQAFSNDVTIYNVPTFYNELNVAKSGSTFTTITDALNYISGNTNENRYIINVNSGLYIENVTLKPFVTLRGLSNSTSILQGLITIDSNVASHQKTRIENLGIRNNENFNITINTDGIVEFKNCFIESFYTSDSILNSVIKLEKGNISFSTSTINLYNTTLDSATENIDTIFYINNNNIVNFYNDNLVTNIYTYDNNNKLLLAYNTNSYTGSTFSYKDIQHNIFLYNLSSNNLITSIYNSGCSNTTVVQDMNINLNVDSTSENAKIMFAYNTQSIGLSKIKITNVNLNVIKGNIADGHFYIGASTHSNDRVYINNSNISLLSDILPTIYTVNGNSGLTYYSISNTFGSTFNNNTIIGSSNQIVNKQYVDYVVSQISGGTMSGVTAHSGLTGLGNDDHLQYLRTDGTRNLTGIQRYTSHPSFSGNTDLIDKKYVDDLINTRLSLSGGTMYSGISFDTDAGIYGRQIIGSIGLGDENAMKLYSKSIISLDAPAIQIKHASGSGYTGSILTIGENGFISYSSLSNNDVEYLDDTPSITYITDTNENTIFSVTVDESFNKGYVEWSIVGNIPYWRTLNLKVKVNGITKYQETYTNQFDYSFNFSAPINDAISSGDTITVTISSDVANYYVYGDFLKVVKYGIKAGVYWGSIGGDIYYQTDLTSYTGLTNYYLKPTIDSLLSGKSNTGHTHTTGDITNLSSYSGFTNYYLKTAVDSLISSSISGISLSDSSLSTAISTETSIRLSVDSSLSTNISISVTGITSLSTAVSTENSVRSSVDSSLSTNISTETSVRNSADISLSTAISGVSLSDTSLSTAISTETSTRNSSDVSLSTAVSERVSVDTSLSTNISTETSMRSSADNSLSTAISGVSISDSSLSTAISTETSTRSSADTSLSSAVSNETSIRNSSDTSLSTAITSVTGNTGSLSTAISTEISNRTSADISLSTVVSTSITGITSLSTAVSTANSVRNNADTSLSTAVSTEISSRESVDTSLSTAISNSNTGITSLSTAVSSEISVRNSADISLSTIISSEISNRISGDTSLSTAISNINITGVTSLSTAVSSEISIRSSADTSLSTAISSRVSVDSSLSTNISTETSIRSSADTSLSSVINSITGNTTSLSTAISTETSTRISSDTSLSTAISTSVTGITSLSTAVSSETSIRSSADTSLSTAISSRVTVDASMSTSIVNETITRISADTSLSTAITSVTGNTSSLSTAISTETSIRSSSDTSLSTAISTRVSVDTSLSTNISTEASTRNSADISLSTAIISGGGSGTTSLSTALSSEISIRSSADSSLSTAVLNHTHTTSSITNLSTYSGFTNYYTQTSTNTLLNNKLSLSGGTMTGALVVNADLTSNKYIMASDLIIYPIVGNQSSIRSWWGLQLRGNSQTNLTTSPVAFGANNDYSVLVITDTNSPTIATFAVIGNETQSSPLQIWRNGTQDYNASISITGQGTFNGIISNNNVSITNNLYVSGSTNLYGALNMYGTTTYYGSVIYTTSLSINALYVSSDSSLFGTLFVSGNTSLGSSLYVSQNEYLTGFLRVTGVTSLYNTLSVYNNANFTNNVSISGSTYLGNVTSGVTNQNFTVIDSSTKKLADSGIVFNVYGANFQYVQDLTTTTTTSVTPTYATKVTITTGTLPIGTYRITASYAMSKAITNSDLLQRVQVDGTTLGGIHNYEMSDTASWIYSTRVMFITFATATTHTITLQFSQEAAGTLSMRDSTLEIIRTS